MLHLLRQRSTAIAVLITHPMVLPWTTGDGRGNARRAPAALFSQFRDDTWPSRTGSGRMRQQPRLERAGPRRRAALALADGRRTLVGQRVSVAVLNVHRRVRLRVDGDRASAWRGRAEPPRGRELLIVGIPHRHVGKCHARGGEQRARMYRIDPVRKSGARQVRDLRGLLCVPGA